MVAEPKYSASLKQPTVGQIKRKLAKIQILRLPRNAQISSWGVKESPAKNEKVSFITDGFDMFPAQANKQSVLLAAGRKVLRSQIPVVNLWIIFAATI